jgi:hypothetical protein
LASEVLGLGKILEDFGRFWKILEKQHFKLKTLNIVGENVSLIINQAKMAGLDIWLPSYEP